MKNKTLQEIKNKDITELKKSVHEAKKELLTLSLDHTQFKLKNVRSLFLKRKEIAVMKTILREKEIHGQNI